jgi:hypothetical protein
MLTCIWWMLGIWRFGSVNVMPAPSSDLIPMLLPVTGWKPFGNGFQIPTPGSGER